MANKRVIIVGAGFAGLRAAKTLGNQSGVEVILIDRRNYHLFQPLLYQVATAALSPADIAVPIRSEFKKFANVEVRLGNVEEVRLADRAVIAGGYSLPYDYLILGCGAKHSYFGKNEWEEFAPGLKTLEGATEIRSRILRAFESAENELDPAKQADYLTFVVVGGGPTGMELAGALGEISRHVLTHDFRRIDPKRTRIVLIEAGAHLISMFSEGLSARAERDLTDLGVEVRMGTRVTQVDASGVAFTGPNGEERIAARTVLWAAGVQPSSLGKTLGTALDRAGRVVVAADLSLPGHSEVFVCGDQAHFDVGGGKTLPGLAPVALQQGHAAAINILREIAGKPRRPFRYFDKGQMATIGKRRAVMELGSFRATGWFAWMAWLFIHLYFLVGFRTRVAVVAQWAWSYVFSQRSARLITAKNWKSYG